MACNTPKPPYPALILATLRPRSRWRAWRYRKNPQSSGTHPQYRKKLHIGIDANTGRIVAATLIDRDRDDAAEVAALLDQIQGPMASFTGDGAYDRPTTVYAAVHERHPAADVIVPPRADAVPSDTASTAPSQRDRHIQAIAETGRRAWQRNSGYNIRARVENQIGRFKQVIGDGLRFQRADSRATEVAIAVAVLNRMLDFGRPNSVRAP